MIYPSNYENKTGFDRIRKQVAALCTTQAAMDRIAAEPFSHVRETVERKLSQCDELKVMVTMERGFQVEGFADIGPLLDKVEVEGTFLEVDEILLLRKELGAVGGLVGFFDGKNQGRYPHMYALAEGVEGFPDIASHIDSIIDRFGEVKDSASPELYSIRRSIREREGRAAKKLQQVLHAAQSAGYVDADAAISIRDGRAVIPVGAANKRKVQGFIHDESATGKTFYIEPVEVVEINNELKELEYALRREIVRILTVFTDMLRPLGDGLRRAGDYLVEVETIYAKVRWAIDNGAVKPIISDEGRLDLRRARHPLLEQTLRREGREIVPLDMTLDRRRRILVISGPNAGGKSVCLKTVGLLQYMVQCGYMVPCLENSEFPLLRDIFIDIGDEQSIDNDLSTYSSHLMNMKAVVSGSSQHSLVLIDEFGTGTEPVIGGAIAEAILERLEQRGTMAVITTHYSNLKYYASNAEAVVNGAMTFDVQNITPLFKLEMGMPGSSFAIEIARKIGLPEDIIRSAGEKAGSGLMNLEKQLREVARDRRYWEQKRERIRVSEKRIEELEERYGRELAGIKQERTAILKEARSQAKKLTEEANKQIENTIRVIRESEAEKELTRLARRELDEFRRETQQEVPSEADIDIERRMERITQRQQRRSERKAESKGGTKTATTADAPPKPREVEVGSKVRIKGQDGGGEVTAIKGNKATVAFGQILTTVGKERLEVVSNAEFKRGARQAAPLQRIDAGISERKLNFRHNIDLRGMRASEALEEVQDFIDDAMMVGASEVRILHGKGTGALKEEVRRYLRGMPGIASAADEHADRGGAGITVVKLEN